MKYLISTVVLLLIASFARADRIGTYDNAKVYLREAPCEKIEGMKKGSVVYTTGKAVGLCWIEENGVIWIIDDEGTVTAEDPMRIKVQP